MTSPAIDFNAICVALAARFATAAIGTPTGAVAMRQSLAQTPKQIGTDGPVHLLEVTDGSLIANPGQWKHEMHVDGLLLLSKRPGDPARVEKQRKLWLPYLLHATVDQLKLGLGGATNYSVDKALPIGWQWDEFSVGGDDWDAIRVHWAIFVTENVSLTP